MSNPAPIKKLLIVGGGTAGWMAAAWFSKMMGEALDIILVESDDIGTVGVGEATVPSFRRFNDIVGVDEDDLVRETRATFKLGIEFVNWGRIGDRYYHPFGPNGRSLNGIPFHAVWLDSLRAGSKVPISAYNLQALACEAGKFLRPTGDNSPLSTIAYAFQFDATLYARYLRKLAQGRGVARIEGRIVRAEQRSGDGFVEAVVLESGRRIEADLFIDCSGFRGLLIKEALGTEFIDWSHWLPCDRAVVAPCRTDGELLPFTRATAHDAGWQWRIPLQHRTGNGHVYASAFIDDERARQKLMDNLEGPAMADPRVIRFKAGRREVFWDKNVVAIGLAAGFLEPLESTSIYLIQGAIGRLQVLFPDKGFDQADIDCFNRETIKEMEDIRDFIILHYKLTERDDSAFWNYCRTMEVPERIMEKIRLFESRGRIFDANKDQFGQASWFAVMTGQGARPRGSEPLLTPMPPDDVKAWLAEIADLMKRCCDHMPTQKAFLGDHALLADKGSPSP